MDNQNLNIGLSEKDRIVLCQRLSLFLANTYTLYLKTQNFHWNVTGPYFFQLHNMFEEQYLDLAQGIDLLAERIRALGMFTPGSFKEFSRLSTIPEADGVTSAPAMIKQLWEGHEVLSKSGRELIKMAAEVSDDGSADLITQRIQTHEKFAWMLRTQLTAHE